MFKIPEDVMTILNRMHQSGHEAYIVGGCVRDMLLGKTPKDWDITTSATPEQTKFLFHKTIDTGIEHGTVTVMFHGEGYEITTYRIEGKYEDHRRPLDVEFTRNISEDLLRRDFTINAMAYNEEEGIVDLYKGQEDLKKGVIRCVGNAEERFNEDALRILRGIRFAARFGFELEDATYQAMIKHKALIQYISEERIQVELTKTLISKEPRKMEELVNTGLIHYIIPEFEAIVGLTQENHYHYLTVDQHTYEGLKFVAPDPILRWTFYLHDIGKALTKTVDEKGIAHFYGHPEKSSIQAKVILKRLKFDNKTIKDVGHLVKEHDYVIEATPKGLRRGMRRIGVEYFEAWLQIKYADIMAKHPDKRDESLLKLEKLRCVYQEVLASNACLRIKDLAIGGNDLIEVGINPGKQIGEILNKILDKVVEQPELNTEENLLNFIKEEGYLN